VNFKWEQVQQDLVGRVERNHTSYVEDAVSILIILERKGAPLVVLVTLLQCVLTIGTRRNKSG